MVSATTACSNSSNTYTSKEIAQRAGIHLRTLQRWLAEGSIPEPRRNRVGWRLWTDRELDAVLAYTNRVLPPREQPRAGHP